MSGAAVLKRSQRGLYGGKTKQFGNQISHSNRHSRRTWSPNVQTKRVWSDSLERKIKIRMTTSVLKTIDSYGGLDNYVLGAPHLDSLFGEQLRNAIIAKRYPERARQLGLPDAGQGVVRQTRKILTARPSKRTYVKMGIEQTHHRNPFKAPVTGVGIHH